MQKVVYIQKNLLDFHFSSGIKRHASRNNIPSRRRLLFLAPG
jgi:hypothetical protein